MPPSDSREPRSGRDGDDRSGLTRRSTLALLGAAGLASGRVSGAPGTAEANGTTTDDGATGNVETTWSGDVDANGHDLWDLGAVEADRVYASARDADVVVWSDVEGTFYADGRDGPVASGSDPIAVIQAAVDSLSEGRTSNERVLVASPATVGQDADFPIQLPSYTTLDVPAGIHVEGEPDEESAVVVRATDADSVELPSLTVTGYPNFCVWIQSCSNVRLGDVSIRHAEDALSNTVVRIDDFGETGRTTDVQVDQVYVEEGGHHAFETYGVDRIQVDQVTGVNPDGCVVLLNDTTDATVNSVVGREPGVPAGYATFRVANGTHDVTVGEVVSRGGARGIFGVSECYDVTIGEVNVVGAENGVLVQNCRNFAIEGGVVKNSGGDGVRVDTRDDGEQIPAEGVSISNLRVTDDREEPQQAYGIRETGPRTNHNRFVNNDLRGAGTEAALAVFADSTVVRDNVGAGVADGSVTLRPGRSPAARVAGVSDLPGVSPEVRAEPVDAPDANYAWDHYFAWDGDAGAWDLHFEWRTDPGAPVEVSYVVDRSDAGAPGTLEVPARFYQVDFVAGEPIEELGEEGLYAEQDRLMRFAFGSVEEGITEKDTAWPSAELRDCLDYGHIREHDDGTASVTFTVADDCEEVTLSLATYSLPGEEFSADTADEQELLGATTETYGPGEHTISLDLPSGE
ncbi:right-handed parallel beta-helix repeat-containing protein [Candidatus Halobonum tyrrellensis]|uniref:Right handed beta helix domain-containing protein n=1 Tax=Candidatus Halobonum tyrrellensis G22 TaxID=1324957 RepID=V4HGQ8_9EURY|nr:right-handed parallel beta-helix repeat-containing protein [Candidatus Halobonum tyrrellensis]ESP87004.1 hypothetical protein K933_15832 [Candidatus Halobonum tyrrellensis G22]